MKANFINPDLPWLCFTTHPVTGEEVIIENGKKGFFPIEALMQEENELPKTMALAFHPISDLTIDERNAKLGVTPDQVQKMTLRSFTGNWA